MSQKHHAALVVTALAFAVIGCGGSKSTAQTESTSGTGASDVSSVASTGPLTKAELIAKADLICKGVTDKLEATSLGSQQAVAEFAPKMAAYEHAAVAEMKKLTPGADLTKDWKQVVASMQMLAENTDKLSEAAKKVGNFVNSERVLGSVNLDSRRPLLATAKRVGFKDCAEVL